MKIVVLDGYALNPGDIDWEEMYQIDPHASIHDVTEIKDVIDRIGDAEILIVNKIKITREIMEKAPNLKYIGVLATGYDIIDVQAATDLGIKVTNVPGYGTESVAQFVFALLLELCNHVAHHEKRVREGAWEEYNEFCFWEKPLMELNGKKLGIIGFGKIGRKTAEIAKAFGMRVIVNTKKDESFDEVAGVEYMSLEELYRQADIISLHCPLFEDTYEMINKKSIGMMKDNVILINTSRGGLINEADLLEALESGKVAAAGLDVMKSEPPKSDNPLIGAKNCIITPHIAWAPKEARARLMEIAVENIRGFIKGEDKNVVN